jgi:hypothetical protein
LEQRESGESQAYCDVVQRHGALEGSARGNGRGYRDGDNMKFERQIVIDRDVARGSGPTFSCRNAKSDQYTAHPGRIRLWTWLTDQGTKNLLVGILSGGIVDGEGESEVGCRVSLEPMKPGRRHK